MSLNRIVYTILVFPSYYSYQIVYLSAPLPLSLSPSFLFLFCAPDYLAKQLRDGLIFSRGGGQTHRISNSSRCDIAGGIMVPSAAAGAVTERRAGGHCL